MTGIGLGIVRIDEFGVLAVVTLAQRARAEAGGFVL